MLQICDQFANVSLTVEPPLHSSQVRLQGSLRNTWEPPHPPPRHSVCDDARRGGICSRVSSSERKTKPADAPQIFAAPDSDF